MKLSFIISILDSHEVARHYARHLRRMGLNPDVVEIMFIDDGSEVPLCKVVEQFHGLKVYETNDRRKWTGGLARNMAARVARGEYLLMTDVDHIFTLDAITACLNFTEDKMVFFRYAGYFNGRSEIVSDHDSLLKWGIHPSLLARDGCAGVHTNTFCIRREVFWQLGGYDIGRCVMQDHRMGEDREFNRRWSRAVSRGAFRHQATGPNIFFYPTGRFRIDGDDNPYGLFHRQKREKWGDP